MSQLKQEIDHLKMMIEADEKVWSELYDEEQKIKCQRNKIFDRKYKNQTKLKKLLGVDKIL